jgi:hypothetical protein
MTSSSNSSKIPKLVTHCKVILGIFIGIACAIMRIRGSSGFTMFAGFGNMVAIMLAGTLGVDSDKVGGKSAIFLEGLMPAMATFILCWTAGSNYLDQTS